MFIGVWMICHKDGHWFFSGPSQAWIWFATAATGRKNMKKFKIVCVLILAVLIFLPIKGGGILEKKNKVAFEEVVTIPEEEPASVPIPATVVLFVSGIIGLVGVNRMLRK